MRRYTINAHILSVGTDHQKAVPTFAESKSGRFVMFKDVEDIIKKAEYWEDQFRKEWKRVGELCTQRDRIRSTLKRLLDEQV